ncbi:Alpha/beta hydrolase fold-3 domain-containing protein [Penicillium ucsense]|uniref:Alpha/beta hydrolase fold-3 domain-containing protein n=1 Tax=Penicillium ucsense TaxID=2839758 RepID=A0A8J8W068_9EURO|nr:Alpha/beta hydrolase fold-3 domain-containing protein [Penicillium ucsense]KAF7739492.1 Alpha/beta hydrolase fold-3 domain-containing protein [Penicillium ucsense]
MSIPLDPKLDGFEIIQANYKHIGDHAIRTDILIPRTEHSGPRPLIVRVHGGGLMMGDSLYMDWWPHWVSDLALQKNAVIISPNYRLMPEATSFDIFADMADFWAWLQSSLLREVLAAHTPPTAIDLDRIFVTGESAGGLLSVHLALTYPDQIRAASAAYPAVALNAETFTQPRASPPFGLDIPETLVQETLDSIALGTAVSSLTSQKRVDFMLGAIQHGFLSRLYERGAEPVPPNVLYPILKVEQSDLKVPRGGLVVLHGRHDSVVPLRDSERFVARAQQVLAGRLNEQGRGRVTLVVRDGEHGFDAPARFEEDWPQEAMQDAVSAWLE